MKQDASAAFRGSATLSELVHRFDEHNQHAHRQMAVFDPAHCAKWTDAQKRHFVRTFYHVRGHFVDFLWLLGNQAPQEAGKDRVLHNFREEFGEAGHSHEKLYEQFAQQFGVDLHEESLHRKTYLPWIARYNSGHLEWLHGRDWPSQQAAFAAYERLDNVDYADLLKVADAIGAQGPARTFFQVHAAVQHYQTVADALEQDWVRHSQKITDAFAFIADHQNAMWQRLGEEIGSQRG